MLKEELGLARHRIGQRLIEVRERQRIRFNLVQVLKPKPLRSEASAERVGSRVSEHALNLTIEHVGPRQPAATRDVDQLRIRNRAPQEKRQPRREVEVADAVSSPWLHVRWCLFGA